MEFRPGERRLHPAWWTAILLVTLIAALAGTAVLYSGSLKSVVPVVVTSNRAGLIMESGSKVMMSGVQVGHVTGITGGRDQVELKLDIDSDQAANIPANVGAQIRATTAFGAKYVDLVYPDQPSAQHLRAGAVLASRNVTTEVNTVFENLVGLLDQIDPAKLNSVLGALSEGFRGQGQQIGEAITDANQVLLELNPRSETIRQDWRSLKSFSDTYAAAADDILSVLDAASTTSTTVVKHSAALDTLLLNVIGLSKTGTDLLSSNERNLVDAVNILAPTTHLLLKYNPELTCTLVGAQWWLNQGGGLKNIGGNGYSFVADAAVLLGDDKYKYPDNLPIVAAKGGPGGAPGCGSLPDATKMFPVRALVTNTGWGTGMDWRPNPGVAAQTCYADFLPVTRAVPEPPSLRDCLPGPAIGPVTAPGMPPYGAALYGPGGVPLWPGLPPAGTPPPVPAPGTPVAPGKMPPQPPAVLGAPPPPVPAPAQALPCLFYTSAASDDSSRLPPPRRLIPHQRQ
ncbi:MCE family protein, partial [Mycolicibacterium stellerae]|uniref:MCE family protein n=1 Tax=Mycolicibacterium stellerae TaxID=2358193 RepID=UPI000F0B183A